MDPINFNSGTDLLAQRIYRFNTQRQAESLHKLATGLRINRASDDPSGLITSERLRALLEALEAETRSARRAEDVINVADGALGDVSDLLNEAHALVLRNANTGGFSAAEREANQMELDSVISTINRIASDTRFNDERLFDGSVTVGVDGQTITIDDISSSRLGELDRGGETYSLNDLKAGGELNIVDGDLGLAEEVITVARSKVAGLRGDLGAFVTHTIGSRLNILGVSMQNIAAAESRIRDLDYAQETSTRSLLQILVQASGEAIRLSGDRPRSVLNLLA